MTSMRRPPRALTSVSVVAVLVAGGVTGCSGGDGGGGTASSAAASGGASVTASSASAVPSAEAPQGTSWVETKASGLRFAVPEDWTVFDTASLTQNRDEALIKELTETFDMTEEQLAQTFEQMDLMVVGPPQDDFAPNVNVVRNLLTALPAGSAMAAELESVGATVGTPSEETTPLGPAVVVPYSLTSGSTDIKGRSVVVEGPDGFVTLSISHVSEDLADDVTSTILSTIGAS